MLEDVLTVKVTTLIETKKCRRCGRIKPLTDFYKAKYKGWCKKCFITYISTRYHTNLEKSREKSRKSAAAHQKENVIRTKQWRHATGISKHYKGDVLNGVSYTKEYKRLHRKIYKYNKKNAGELTTGTIQLVYEDNVKRFGTLTCYLCVELIPFGKDHLEHKTPLSRGGTNEYNNLGVACQHCNNKKHNKTVEEYFKYELAMEKESKSVEKQCRIGSR